MSSRMMQLIACRLYSLLFAATGVFSIGVGAVGLYDWAFGLPVELHARLSTAELRPWFLIGSAGFTLFGAVHVFLSIFAWFARIWPMVVGTLFWTFLITAPFTRPVWTRGFGVADIVVLGTLVVLTMLALIARYMSTRIPIA